VNFLSGTLASLPLKVYRNTKNGREEVKNGVAPLLSRAANDETSSFAWRKYSFDALFTSGRMLTYIEKNNAGKIVNLWPMDPTKVEIKMSGGRKTYTEKSNGKSKVYSADEILDVPFMLKADGVSHRGPIATNRDTIGLAISATGYGSKVFNNGGLPPAVLNGPFGSAAGAQRASDDIGQAMAKRANEGGHVLALPDGHTLTSVGFSPEKMQLVELKRFLIEEIARIYSLPPVFLQDLTHGTFSNTEQQDLQLVKHTLGRWVSQVEAELNLKLFGRVSKYYVKFNVDGLLRGDFKTRMEGHAQSIQNAIRTPNEARALENLGQMDGGDELMIQGATVPIGSQNIGAE